MPGVSNPAGRFYWMAPIDGWIGQAKHTPASGREEILAQCRQVLGNTVASRKGMCCGVGRYRVVLCIAARSALHVGTSGPLDRCPGPGAATIHRFFSMFSGLPTLLAPSG